MLSEYFQKHFDLMPKPEDMSADEARRLVIDAYRLLINYRLELAGVDVQVKGTVATAENELDILRRLADYLSAYTAISASLPRTQISPPTVCSANFVTAQIFEFLAEYQAIGLGVLEQRTGGTEPFMFNGFEFWTEEGYLWISAIAHYLLARHDGNATTLACRFRELPKLTNGWGLSTWAVGSDAGYKLASAVVAIVVSFLGCDFLEVLRTAGDQAAMFSSIQSACNDFELTDLVLISALFDISQACVQMAQALTSLVEAEARARKPWLEMKGYQ